jgi:hypothetical protein
MKSILIKSCFEHFISFCRRRTPEQVFYSDSSGIRGESSIKNFDEIGPIIEHTYIITNGGPFTVNFFQLIVDWPYELRLRDFNPKSSIKYYDGKHLLYLAEKPTVNCFFSN